MVLVSVYIVSFRDVELPIYHLVFIKRDMNKILRLGTLLSPNKSTHATLYSMLNKSEDFKTVISS